MPPATAAPPALPAVTSAMQSVVVHARLCNVADLREGGIQSGSPKLRKEVDSIRNTYSAMGRAVRGAMPTAASRARAAAIRMVS